MRPYAAAAFATWINRIGLVMSSANTIQTLRFTLHAPLELADEVQRRCSALFHRQLRWDIGKVLLDISQESGVPITIDRLVLDLGHMTAGEFEIQLRQRLLPQLAQQLRAYVAAAPPWPQPPQSSAPPQRAALAPVGERAAAGEATSAGAPASLQAEDAVMLLTTYLQHGYLPHPQLWQQPAGPDGWLSAQLQQDPGPWRAALARCCLQALPLQRLRQTFQDATLHAIGRLLTAAALPPPIPAHGNAAGLLPLCALLYFQRHPAADMPLPGDPWPAASLTPEWVAGVQHLLAYPLPSSPALRHWLQTLCAPASVQAQLAAQLPPALLPKLEQLLQQPDGIAAQKGHPTRQQPDGTAAQASDPAWQQPGGAAAQASHPAPQQPAGAAAQASHPTLRQPDRAAAEASHRTEPLRPTRSPPEFITASEQLAVSNAGIVLLWPLLPGWLAQLGLVAQQDQQWRFIDPAAQVQAVCWLDWLVWGEGAAAEWRTPLTKYLCGLPLDWPLLPWDAPQPPLAEQLAGWLAGLPQLLGIEACSAQDVRSLFLQRPGQLRMQDARWTLQVDSDAGDVLLRDLPWPMEQVLLPWLDSPLPVSWLGT